ncbi:MAG TPA: hypothetical protein GX727_07735 [Clostridium sp.]|jgi:hypothetical protein|nr:hypothetical protein [Clostridium sp.]
MKRLEKYRAIRIARKKSLFMLLMCFVVISAGVLTVDYSLNALMNGENGIKLFAIEKIEDEYYQFKIFNKSLYLNTDYVKEDFNKFVEWANKSLKEND